MYVSDTMILMHIEAKDVNLFILYEDFSFLLNLGRCISYTSNLVA